MTMSNALITGADGFIGSHLTELLISRGYNVRALVQYNSFDSWGWLDHLPDSMKNAIEVQAGDVRDSSMMMRAVEGMDIVFNLAALISIPYSYEAPYSIVDTNLLGTINLLEACRVYKVNRFIQTSTSEVYGTAQYVPMDEKHPLNAQSPYAASKIAADQMVAAYNSSFDFPATIIRPFNTYGPRQSQRAIVPTIITQLLGGKKEIKLGSVTPTRDLNFVTDICEGFLAAAVAEESSSLGKVFNLGSNFEVSISEIVEIVASIIGVKAEIVTEERRMRPKASEVERLFADNSKAMDLLDWNPRFCGEDGFRLGLKHTIEWFKNPENLKMYKIGQYSV